MAPLEWVLKLEGLVFPNVRHKEIKTKTLSDSHSP